MTLKQWADNGWLKPHKTIQTLPLILGPERKNDANYLDACRSKRNIVEYDYIGGVTDDDAIELIDFVKGLKGEVEKWLEREHPDFR